jgi:hypothetical protein
MASRDQESGWAAYQFTVNEKVSDKKTSVPYYICIHMAALQLLRVASELLKAACFFLLLNGIIASSLLLVRLRLWAEEKSVR